MTSNSIVKRASNILSLLSVVAIAISTTLSFWLVLQYSTSLEQNRGLVILLAYVGLIAGYYGIAPLSTSVQEKTEWILNKAFGAAEPDASAQEEAIQVAEARSVVEASVLVSEPAPESTITPPQILDVDIEILITRHDGATNPDLPSHLFPGCGSDGAKFSVQGVSIPTYTEIDRRLSKWDMDCCLVEYDEVTGDGYFRMVDADAPPKGTLILLQPLS